MAKIHFSGKLPYALKRKVVRDLKIVTVTVAVLDVHYTGDFHADANPLDIDHRYQVDIDHIYLNGADIKEVLEAVSDLDDIHEKVQRHFAHLMESKIAA